MLVGRVSPGPTPVYFVNGDGDVPLMCYDSGECTVFGGLGGTGTTAALQYYLVLRKLRICRFQIVCDSKTSFQESEKPSSNPN